eukprot:jgi/Undpi1/6651/HiC_scaffold_20.g09130.m1
MSASSAGAANDAATGVCAEVIPVPILSDNYAYLLVDPVTRKTACVDPAEPEKVMVAAIDRGLEISVLLCTHKHWDHSGGNEAMKKMIPGLEVVSSAYEDDVPAVSLRGSARQRVFSGRLKATLPRPPLADNGATPDQAAAEEAPSDGERREGLAPLVFSGDTLFVGGCGRFFEGDASQMSNALQGVASKLPGATRVFCGHEYTIAQELEHNPFMRINEKAIREATGTGSGVDAMKRLREMKNGFRPPPLTAGRFPAL